jgi:hypothetical protein
MDNISQSQYDNLRVTRLGIERAIKALHAADDQLTEFEWDEGKPNKAELCQCLAMAKEHLAGAALAGKRVRQPKLVAKKTATKKVA